MLELNGNTVVAGAIVRAEERNVWRSVGKRKAGDEFVAAILMDALLVFVGQADAPVFCPAVGKVVFDGGARLERVRRVVARIDEGALAAVCAAGKTRWIRQIVDSARCDRLIDCDECVDPTVLREVVVIKTDAGSKYGVL